MGPHRCSINALITCLICLMATGGGTSGLGVQLQIEVHIPERTVVYIEEQEERAGSGAETLTAWSTVFDLACATLGSLPAHCLTHYGGPLLDTRGRPYPPQEVDGNGRVVTRGDFPQFFESPRSTIRVYTPAMNWQLQAELLQADALAIDRLAVGSSPEAWHCLGFHPDWEDIATCPPGTAAASRPVTVMRVANNEGGWHEVPLRLKLRLDGSELNGSYSGVIRYTVVSF